MSILTARNKVLQGLEITRAEAERRYEEGKPWTWVGMGKDDEGNGRVDGLLTVNPKVEKGEKYGYRTSILHLAPARQSGYQACGLETEGCAAACLNASGHGLVIGDRGTNNVQVKRMLRTFWYFRDREVFMKRLVREIENELKTTMEMRDLYTGGAVFRLNGTSDIPWENVPVERNGKKFNNVFEAFPNTTFYDYTKRPNRKNLPDNYSLTFSLADGNEEHAYEAVKNGMNLAVVFRTEEIIPEEYHVGDITLPVIDGDLNDLRFLDPKGCVVSLYAKGYGALDETGFVKDTDRIDLPVLDTIAA